MRGKLTAALVVLAVAACTVHAVRADSPSALALVSGGRERTYVEYVPTSPQGKPLLLALHGRGGTAAGQEKLSHLSRLAASGEAVVVMPQGLDKSWADLRGVTPSSQAGVDDVAFLRELIDEELRKYALDASRVYVTGMSNGGFMTLTLACQLADQIAAVASVTGGVSTQTQTTCTPARSIPVLLVMGENDPLVPYAGGALKAGRGTVLSAPEGAAMFAKFDGCSAESNSGPVDSVSDDGTSVSTRVFTGCREGAEVRLLTVHGGGHTWPGGAGYLPELIIGKTSREFDASAEIWKFFTRFKR